MILYGSPWISGSSAMRFESTVNPMLASVVLSAALSAVTLTASSTPPTSSTIDRSRVSLIWTCTLSWMCFLKPVTSTVTW